MDRLDRILRHPTFLKEQEAIEALEQERIFCRHDYAHLLDVARLMTVYAMEEGLHIPRDVIYAAALLHDIGRGEQYRTGTPHDLAGAAMARQILAQCGYTSEEQGRIADAILAHRGGQHSDPLGELLYRADKKSRPCYRCQASGECNWPMEKRNLTLEG